MQLAQVEEELSDEEGEEEADEQPGSLSRLGRCAMRRGTSALSSRIGNPSNSTFTVASAAVGALAACEAQRASATRKIASDRIGSAR